MDLLANHGGGRLFPGNAPVIYLSQSNVNIQDSTAEDSEYLFKQIEEEIFTVYI